MDTYDTGCSQRMSVNESDAVNLPMIATVNFEIGPGSYNFKPRGMSEVLRQINISAAPVLVELLEQVHLPSTRAADIKRRRLSYS